MQDNLVSFKCPSCDTSLLYDAESGKFKCPACDNMYELAQIENATSAGATAFDWGEYISSKHNESLTGTVSYVCKYCAAEIVTDATTSATRCPYCDNEIIIAPQLEGSLRPNYIIPFKIDKKNIQSIVKDIVKRRKLLPRNFLNDVVIEKAHGFYVPFWLFDCTDDGTMTFETTRTRSWTSGSYDYTETSYYYVTVDGGVTFKKIPVDASIKMDNATMDKLEPYDYSALEEFAPGYLSGFVADRYDDNVETCLPRADSRIKGAVSDTFSAEVTGYSSKRQMASNIQLNDTNAKYALLPVYLMKAKYKDTEYQYAINGQTGKFVGEFPQAKSRFWLYFLKYLGIFAAILLILFFLFN
jgi:DNA-directed RNA polymerase subunit RPC12/RpoP